jgi:hypothetical protein
MDRSWLKVSHRRHRDQPGRRSRSNRDERIERNIGFLRDQGCHRALTVRPLADAHAPACPSLEVVQSDCATSDRAAQGGRPNLLTATDYRRVSDRDGVWNRLIDSLKPVEARSCGSKSHTSRRCFSSDDALGIGDSCGACTSRPTYNEDARIAGPAII